MLIFFFFFYFIFIVSGTIHERFNGKGYYYSWADPRTNGQEVDWLSGRNFCRQRCMDLVSLETSAENEFIKSRIVQSERGIFYLVIFNFYYIHMDINIVHNINIYNTKFILFILFNFIQLFYR